MNIRYFIKEYFTFNASERRGIRFMLIIILLMVVVLLALPFFPAGKTFDPGNFQAEVREFLALRDTMEAAEKRRRTFPRYAAPREPWKQFYRYPEKKTAGAELPSAPFDPNGLPAEAWMKLGLSEKQALSIKKYEKSGGRFYKNEDLRKMYVIDDAFYRRIEPFLAIANPGGEVPNSAKRVNINTADEWMLQDVDGVGLRLAAKIVELRTRLGGFYSLEQLKEIYTMSAENFDRMAPVFHTGAGPEHKININYCGKEELARHPYVGYGLSGKIVRYRNEHGPFSATGDLLRLGLVDAELYDKLVHYITVE